MGKKIKNSFLKEIFEETGYDKRFVKSGWISREMSVCITAKSVYITAKEVREVEKPIKISVIKNFVERNFKILSLIIGLFG